MQSTPSTLAKRALAILTAIALSAVFIAGTTNAGIQGSGFMRLAVMGRITGFGSIFVNGVEYSTHDARIGQIVTLSGSVDAHGTLGRADVVSFVNDVRGPITAIDSGAHSFSVLGQTVRLTGETLTNQAQLRVGTTVAVSGFPNAAGEIVASRVDVEKSKGGQVRGAVTALDHNAGTFMLHSLLVDYQNAKIDGALAEGATVVVHGKTLGSTLVAKRVKVSDELSTNGGQGDIEGLITIFASDAEFAINGQRVVGDEHTKYKLKGGALGPDVTVRVKGRFEGGTLLADEVESELRNRDAADHE
jgi:Domain of unknown function (DUF5666)